MHTIKCGSRFTTKGAPFLGIALALWTFSADASASAQVLAPGNGSVVPLGRVAVELLACADGGAAPAEVWLDDEPIEVRWTPLPYKRRWFSWIEVTTPGHHHLDFKMSCPSGPRGLTARFEALPAAISARRSGAALARNYMLSNPAKKAAWDWEEAVFLFALGRWTELTGDLDHSTFLRYLVDYHGHWDRKGAPNIDRSDRCAPALSGAWLVEAQGDWVAARGLRAVADYLLREPRNSSGAIDHLGHSWLAAFFPGSIWVDSLVMYALAAERLGRLLGVEDLTRFALSQPRIFAEKLREPTTGLFRHAWIESCDTRLPKEHAFWLRGNGWVATAVAEMLSTMSPDDPERPGQLDLLRGLAMGSVRTQLVNGAWDSILTEPGFSYPEASGTALLAYGIERGVRRGWLDPKLSGVSDSAFRYLSAKLHDPGESDGGLSMPEISGSTNPMPKSGYRLIPRKSDTGYGVGAFLLLASEFAR